MELGVEISQKVKKTIKRQLQTLGSYVDDELPEYIMVMIANKRTREQMVEDLNLFLNDEADKFVSWLFVILDRIQKAMQLPGIDAIIEEETVSKNDTKKKSKKNKNDEVDNEDKRQFKEKKKDDPEREKARKQREEEQKKRDKERESEISRRRKEREKRAREDEGRKNNARKNIDSGNRKSSSGEQRKLSHSEKADKNNDKEVDIRLEAEEEAKRIERRSDRNRNPMDFVKQIAKDIDKKLLSPEDEKSNTKIGEEKQPVEKQPVEKQPVEKQPVEKSDLKDVGKSADPVEFNNSSLDGGTLGNISLHAVTQYDDGENEIEKTDKSNDKRKRSHSHDKQHSHKSKISKSRSKSPPKTKSKSPKRRDRSRSGGRKGWRSRERSRSKSPKSLRRSSRSRNSRRSRSRSPRMHTTRSHSDSHHHSKRHSRSRSRDRARRGSNRSKSRSHSKEKDSSEKYRSSTKSAEKRKVPTVVNEESKVEKVQPIPSQVKVVTDFQRKPSLSRHQQATSALLKKAVTEAVNEKPEENTEIGDSIEFDYTENIEVLHKEESTYSDLKTKCAGSDRKVILDDVDDGLATITVNIKAKDNLRDRSYKKSSHDQSRSHDKSRRLDASKRKQKGGVKSSDDEDIELRKGLLHDMSKLDARYAILKSRLDHATSTRTGVHGNTAGSQARRNRNEPKKERYLGSMVADMEEESRLSKLRKDRNMRWEERKRMLQVRRRADLVRSRDHRGKSSDEESAGPKQRVGTLKQETKNIGRHEQKRSLRLSSGGDLRNLLSKRLGAVSSSDDEDTIARKLREKIKEEKHKKLFGLLKPNEMELLKKEREDLRQKLKEKHTSRKKKDMAPDDDNSKEEEEGGGGEGEEVEENEEDTKKETSDEEDEWVEDNKKSEDEEEEEEEEEKKEEGVEEEGHRDEEENYEGSEENERNVRAIEEIEQDDAMVSGCEENVVEDENDEGNENEEMAVEEEADEEVKEEEDHEKETIHQTENDSVQDEEAASNNGTPKNDEKTTEISVDDIRKSMHQEDESSPDREAVVEEEKGSKKEDGKKIKSEKKSKHKSSKRRRLRHEFIVTLDGFEGGKGITIKAGTPSRTRERSPKKRRSKEAVTVVSKRKKREKSSSLTQSDEEFKAIIKKSEQGNAAKKHSDHKQRHKRRERSHSGTHDNSSDSIDREILLAEEKLKTQKLLRKSLEQVQSLDTTSLEVKKPKTAFINPRFQQKALPPTLAQTTYVLASQPSLVKCETDLRTLISSTEVIAPTEKVEFITSPNTSVALVSPSNVTEASRSKQPAPAVMSSERTKTQERCLYWPECTNSKCQFVHPNVNCKTFPNCSFGERCLYIHPQCKFGDRCTKADCVFSHLFGTQSAQLCKFGSKCTKMDCPYKHPIAKPCRFGSSCANPDCLYLHERRSKPGSKLKWVSEKSHISERTFALDESVVSTATVTVTTKQP
ncbi:trichohyalin-like [Hydractinia symbiolongicarpus]|uniref:trichohyalin-like n=1 Tax=Hydractinia symbiolongicarpus TaxID=13093 RepID=UPI0025509771|nr:trichohyalin-like [Hydractinia symbiolongicarpus]